MYCFWIEYLGREICLRESELALWKAMEDRVITRQFFETTAKKIAREKGVTRGLLRSTIYRIMGLYREGNYRITEEELEIPEEEREEEIEEIEEEVEEEEEEETTDLCKVEFEYHCRLAYCPSVEGKEAGHDIDTEVELSGTLHIECDYVRQNKDKLIERLEGKLRFSYETFLEEQYILVYDEKYTDCGVSRFDITYEDTVTYDELDEREEEYSLDTVVFRRANECGETYHRLTYFEKQLYEYMDEGLYDFVQEVRRREI